MPFNSNLKAETGADGNGGLNCFIPTVAAIFDEGTHITEKDRMALAFKNYYQINTPFSRDTLRDIIQNTRDPIEREALLAPILRQMMVDRMRLSNPEVDQLKPTEAYITQVSKADTPLCSSDLLYLADDLGISLEAYDPQSNQVDTLRSRKSNLSAFPVNSNAQLHTLKIKNENAHWEFERVWSKDAAENKQMLEAHNAKYHDKLRRFNAEALRNRVRTEVELGHSRLSRIFAESDIALKMASKSAEHDIVGNIASTLKNALSGIASTLKDTYAKITSTASQVVNKVGGMVKSMLGDISANTVGGSLSGITSKMGDFINGIFGGVNSQRGQKENSLTGLFKMFAGLLQAMLAFFGQDTQTAAQKEAARHNPEHTESREVAEPNTRSMDLKANADKSQPADSAVAKKLRELNDLYAANPLSQATQVPQLAQIGHLAQFERTKTESLRFTTDKTREAAKVAALSHR